MRKIIALLALLLMISACTQQAMPDERAAEATTPETTENIPEIPAEEEEEKTVMPQDDLAERLAREQAERIADTLEHPPKLEQRDRETFVEQMWKAYSLLESYKFRMPTGTWYVRGEKVKYLPVNP